jgi:hypothetical protein
VALATNTTAVSAAELHTASRQIITRAVAELWPDTEVVLGPQCPSVTSYVCPVTVGSEEMVAKYAWLGMSLVSILRGAGGTWEEVREAQRAYVKSSAGVTAREAELLQRLRRLGHPRVCGTAGLHDGVLLTRKVTGTPLTAMVAASPWDTEPLLHAVLFTLGDLHSPAGAQSLRGAAPIGERSISTVFSRKFSTPSTTSYLRALGHGQLPEGERQQTVELMQTAVWRLLQMSTALSPRRDTVVYGDLKPEHVILDGTGRRLTFIDPAVQWAAGPQPDVAKLIGRTLLLGLGHPDPRAGRQIVQGATSMLARHIATLPPCNQEAGLREVLVLWLMDTVSILSTCLSAPPGLPLAPHQQDLVAQARTVAGVVDRVSALLVGSMAGPRLLDAVFSELERTAGRAR